MNQYKNIPTNIISGFLGAGKTTAIQSLLKQKPVSENWAVIVNEFGQVGIDGALLKNDEVEIKEIAGGCLCCVSSQALSVGLNKIIRTVKPQRILIEPTGLGHPAKLIELLTGEFYQNVLDLKAIINMLDARNLNDSRYIENATFSDQSNLADILIASKLDTYTKNDITQFYNYASSFKPEKLNIFMIEHGQLNVDWLELPRLDNRQARYENLHSTQPHETDEACDITAINQHWLMIKSRANGFYSVGWRLDKTIIFDRQKLMCIIATLYKKQMIERIKGVVHTQTGWLAINDSKHEHNVEACDANDYTVLEIIVTDDIDSQHFNRELKSTRYDLS